MTAIITPMNFSVSRFRYMFIIPVRYILAMPLPERWRQVWLQVLYLDA